MRREKKLQSKLTQIRRTQEEEKAKFLAEKFKIPYIDLSLFPIAVDDTKILKEEKARESQVLVIKKTGQTLKVGMTNPESEKTKATLKELADQGYTCELLIFSISSFKKGFKNYQLIFETSAPLRGVFIIQQKELIEFEKSIETIQDLRKTITGITTTKLLTIVVAGALKMEVSDIHLEPVKEDIRLRYRVDGILQDITSFPDKTYRFFLSRIKTLADMILNVHDISQDGRFSIKIMDGKKLVKMIDVRISILPAGFGETIVMRLLGVGILKLNLNDLGLRPALLAIMQHEIARPNGMILTTGPTGSGKTTTLYSCLNEVNKPGTKIITVEDPIEYRMEGIIQTQINKRRGQDWNKSLKAVVRQDPDVLMVGEIRDPESADIAIHLALTGHLVFSTLHTNDASGAIPRLIDLGIKPSFIPSSINLVIAQRLVRKLCPDCKQPYQASSDIIESTKKVFSLISPKSGFDIPRNIGTFYKSKGCDKCRGIGYKGRIGIFELFTLDDVIEKMVIEGATSYELQAKAMEQGMVTLLQDSMLRVVDGLTSLEEILRIIGSPEYIEQLYGKAIMSMLTRALTISEEASEWAKELTKIKN